MIHEYNQLKGKPFVPFKNFIEAYRDVQSKPDSAQLQSTREQLSSKLRRRKNGPISLILVSGIPGSGKGRLASNISKLLLADQLKTAFFKMPTVQESARYNTQEFIRALKS